MNKRIRKKKQKQQEQMMKEKQNKKYMAVRQEMIEKYGLEFK